MAHKPEVVVQKMLDNDTKFYPATNTSELAACMASRHPGTAGDFKPLLDRAVKQKKLVLVIGDNDRRGYASHAAVEVGKFRPFMPKPKDQRDHFMPRPAMVGA
ncbi:hypothetical protein CL689_00180 [Candidatus Saccharibacteria bacterium]|nr:hypothetical protein [Candidatus Saccharibacteria bacterium]MBJ58964.1 hypothetical protein [Candidatus Saccharibacteria bacterium]MBQ68468.1 hypothetical protein [Candidatus Saccharibacteria bacterium]|tara:strand:+ start:1436 stop:1744 length:309 start_codon:yes stop_codon:yes gene_type:complete